MNKKAYVRTVEVFIAVLITFIFITFIIPVEQPAVRTKQEINALHLLEEYEHFRSCSMMPDEQLAENCINATISPFIPKKFDYKLSVSDKTVELPEKQVYVESLFMAANITHYEPRIIRLYYWLK